MYTHLAIVISYTFVSTIVYAPDKISDSFLQLLRWDCALIFVGGMADLFICCTLWFVTDEEQTLVTVNQGGKSYVVREVINSKNYEK